MSILDSDDFSIEELIGKTLPKNNFRKEPESKIIVESKPFCKPIVERQTHLQTQNLTNHQHSIIVSWWDYEILN